MWSAEAVLLCALSLLSRSEGTFPRIAFVETPPPGVSAAAEGFVRPDDGTIYLITSAASFRQARAAVYPCGARQALAKVASVVIHEEWHIRHGSDEAGAYAAQLMTLTMLNSGPGTPAYYEVARSMREVLRKRRRQPFRSRIRPRHIT
jgi:hypothetical protein